MKDYILVGLGIAGISFAEVLLQHQKSFIVISDDSQKTSQVAAGLYNPIILKRFSEVWKAQEQLDLLDIFYENLERKLQIKINVKIPIFRKIASIEEQNNWFIAADKPLLAPFLSTQISNTKYKIEPSFFFGAMYVSYALGIAFAFAAFIISYLFCNTTLKTAFIVIVFTLIIFTPIIIRISRNIWINFFIHYDKNYTISL